MGRKRTVHHGLPPNMIKRRRREGDDFLYYFTVPGERKEVALGRPLSAAFKKYKEVSAIYSLGAWAVPKDIHKLIFSRIYRNSKARKVDVLLTETDIKELIEAADGRCQVSGIRFDAKPIDGMRVRPWMPSIDRIDSKKGYSRENCRVVCTAVNFSLNQWGDEVFYAMAAAAAKHLRSAKKLAKQKIADHGTDSESF